MTDAQERVTDAMRSALAAIELVMEASFIEWSELIAPSKRGQEDDDEARKESKDMVWGCLADAAAALREALAQADGVEP